jgi:hypothetical protein
MITPVWRTALLAEPGGGCYAASWTEKALPTRTHERWLAVVPHTMCSRYIPHACHGCALCRLTLAPRVIEKLDGPKPIQNGMALFLRDHTRHGCPRIPRVLHYIISSSNTPGFSDCAARVNTCPPAPHPIYSISSGNRSPLSPCTA